MHKKLGTAFFLGMIVFFIAPTVALAEITISTSANTLQPGQELTVSDPHPLSGSDATCNGVDATGAQVINLTNCAYTTQVWFWRNGFRYKQATIVSSGSNQITVIVPNMPSEGSYRADIEHVYTGKHYVAVYGNTDENLKIINPATPKPTPLPTLKPTTSVEASPSATPITAAPIPTPVENKPEPAHQNFFQHIFSFIRNSVQKLFGKILGKKIVEPSPAPIISAPTSAPSSPLTPTPTVTPIPTPTPVPSPTPKPITYVHSPDSALGVNGFTVTGGQNNEGGGQGIIILKVHGEFTFHAFIWNYGTGMAANVPYIWYDNDKIIKQGVIDHLAPGAETNVTVSFNSVSYSGQHVHKFVINPGSKLPEKSYATSVGNNPWMVEPF